MQADRPLPDPAGLGEPMNADQDHLASLPNSGVRSSDLGRSLPKPSKAAFNAMCSAWSLCPTDMPHLDRMRWMAARVEAAVPRTTGSRQSLRAAQHTSGPWRVCAGGLAVDAPAKNPNVRHASADGREVVCFLSGYFGEQAEANAERIVQCVNAHDDLVAELRDVLDWAVTERAPLREQEIASIRAAIAKATGSTA